MPYQKVNDVKFYYELVGTGASLVIISNEDIITPPIESKKMAEKILHSHVVEISEGHASPIENPQELSKAVIEFLR